MSIKLLTFRLIFLKKRNNKWLCGQLRYNPPGDIVSQTGSCHAPLRHTRKSCLPLLPSGPGGVHSLRVAQDTTILAPGLPSMPTGLYLMLAIRPRCSGLRVTGHRYLPVIAQPNLYFEFLKGFSTR